MCTDHTFYSTTTFDWTEVQESLTPAIPKNTLICTLTLGPLIFDNIDAKLFTTTEFTASELDYIVNKWSRKLALGMIEAGTKLRFWKNMFYYGHF